MKRIWGQYKYWIIALILMGLAYYIYQYKPNQDAKNNSKSAKGDAVKAANDLQSSASKPDKTAAAESLIEDVRMN